MGERIDRLRKELDARFEPEKSDWGFCIPDCGKCCLGSGKETNTDEAKGIAEKLQVPQGDFISDKYPDARRMFLRTEGAGCVFLTGKSLCLIYDFRPKVCRQYGGWLSDCKDYRRIRELAEKGADVRKRLKDMWLKEIKSPSYDRVRWKVRAELLVEDLMRKQAARKIS